MNSFSHDENSIFSAQQVLENRGRVAIFVDGSNLFYAALQLNIEIDYTKLLARLTGGSRLLRAFFYTGVDRTNEKTTRISIVDETQWLSRHCQKIWYNSPMAPKKANLDVEIAVDMMALVGSYDTAVLVSGDGDLAYAVDAVSYRGVRVEVVSLRSMTSDSLINVSDRYIDLENVKEEIQKTPRNK